MSSLQVGGVWNSHRTQTQLVWQEHGDLQGMRLERWAGAGIRMEGKHRRREGVSSHDFH